MTDNNIAIFGDSFGEPIPFGDTTQYPDYIENDQPSWHKNIGAVSYAVGGTDIQNAFVEFEKHHSKYKQIIFVLTVPNRITLFDNDNRILRYVGPEDYHHMVKKANTLGHFELRDMWKELSSLKVINANISWEQRNKLNYLMVVERIKQLRPDIKFIPAYLSDCGVSDMLLQIRHWDMPTLDTISRFEQKIMNWQDCNINNDARVAHLTEESHVILTTLISKWITNKEMFFKFDLQEFKNIDPDRSKYDISKWKR